MRRPLGCLTGSGLLAAALTIVVIGVAAAATGNAIFSPGQLNAVVADSPYGGIVSHAELSQRCAACHPAFWDADRQADRCLACHTEVAAELKDPGSLHGGLPTPNDCRLCHTEHEGPGGKLTEVGLSDFPHDRFGFSLQAHQERSPGVPFECQHCHGEQFAAVADQTCDSCHLATGGRAAVDHSLTFGVSCQACHDGIDSYGADFDHASTAFDLLGGHQDLACASCHGGARSLKDLQATPKACVGCHQKENIHQAQLGTDCQVCHTPESWEGASFDHGLAAFALEGAHLGVECEACHRQRQWVDIPSQCSACHEKDDVHKSTLGLACERCHQPTDWAAVTFDHATSTFPLTGAHLLLDCQQCHADAVFAGTPGTCYGCHAGSDEHQGKYGRACEACHVTTSWSEVTFDHQLSQFPLNGAHARLACNSCHGDGVFAGLSTSCASCHREPSYHAGLFGSDCGSCHNTSNWDARFTGDHSFPMGHGGADGRCSRCHTDTLTDYTCFTCHDQGEIMDKHDEISGGLGDCVECHAGGDKGEDD